MLKQAWCCCLWQGGNERLHLLLLLLRGSHQQEVERPRSERAAAARSSMDSKCVTTLSFISGDIISLLWTSWILLKSKLKGLGPRVSVHALKSIVPAPHHSPLHHHHTTQVWLWCSAERSFWLTFFFFLTQQEVICYSVEHFSSQTHHLRIAQICQKCCTCARGFGAVNILCCSTWGNIWNFPRMLRWNHDLNRSMLMSSSCLVHLLENKTKNPQSR